MVLVIAVPAAVRHPGDHRGAVPAACSSASSAPRSSTSPTAPTRCCGSTCSGSSATPRCTSSSCRRFGIVVRGAAGVLPQAAVRLPVRRLLRRGHRLPRLGRVGPPHVRLRPRAGLSVAVFSVATMAIAIPTGVKIVNWTLTMWGGKLRFTTAMLFAIGLDRRVHDRRPVRRHPRRGAVGHAADRHLLHRRPLPLRAVRRRRARPLRRLLLLVAEGLRQDAQREARQVELLADDHRHEPDVRADAHPRPAGPAAAHVRLDRGPRRRGLLQPRVLEPGRRRSARSSSPSACCCSSSTCCTRTRKAPKAPLDPWDARSSSG